MPWIEQLPSGRYRAMYRTKTGAKRSAGTFAHKRRAENAAAAAEEAARTLGWRDPKAGQKTWGEWCEAWWPTRPVEPGTLVRDESSRDSTLMPRWGDVPLAEITRHDVKAWAAQLKREGKAPATVQQRIHLLSASLTAAIDAEVLTTNPASKIAIAKGQTDVRRYLTAAERGDLLAQFRPPVNEPLGDSLVSTLLGTGMRWGECVGLQVNRVDLQRGTLRVAEVWDDKMGRLKAYPKGRKIREALPIPPWLMPHLEARVRGRRTGFVFETASGNVVGYSNWRSRSWVPGAKRAGLDGVRIHDLRHTYASVLLQNGVPLAEVGKLLGHVSPLTTQIYAHLQETDRSHIVAALPDPSRG